MNFIFLAMTMPTELSKRARTTYTRQTERFGKIRRQAQMAHWPIYNLPDPSSTNGVRSQDTDLSL